MMNPNGIISGNLLWKHIVSASAHTDMNCIVSYPFESGICPPIMPLIAIEKNIYVIKIYANAIASMILSVIVMNCGSRRRLAKSNVLITNITMPIEVSDIDNIFVYVNLL